MATVISASELTALGDELARIWVRALSGLGTLGGGTGASDAADDLVAQVDSLSINPTRDIGAQALRLQERMNAAQAVRYANRDLMLALDRHARLRSGISGVYDLNTYLSHLNTADVTKWSAMMPDGYRNLHYACLDSYPVASNVYFEIVQGGDFTNALRKLEIGTGETAGDAVDEAKYAGGFPKLNCTGITGSDTVTVTGDAFNPATQTVSEGVTWTASVSGDGVVALEEGTAPTDSLIVAATGISAGGSLTAGTIYVEAHRPSGRPAIS